MEQAVPKTTAAIKMRVSTNPHLLTDDEPPSAMMIDKLYEVELQVHSRTRCLLVKWISVRELSDRIGGARFGNIDHAICWCPFSLAAPID